MGALLPPPLDGSMSAERQARSVGTRPSSTPVARARDVSRPTFSWSAQHPAAWTDEQSYRRMSAVKRPAPHPRSPGGVEASSYDGEAWLSQASYAIHGRWLLVDCFFEWKLYVKRQTDSRRRLAGLSGNAPPPGVTWRRRRRREPEQPMETGQAEVQAQSKVEKAAEAAAAASEYLVQSRLRRERRALKAGAVPAGYLEPQEGREERPLVVSELNDRQHRAQLSFTEYVATGGRVATPPRPSKMGGLEAACDQLEGGLTALRRMLRGQLGERVDVAEVVRSPARKHKRQEDEHGRGQRKHPQHGTLHSHRPTIAWQAHHPAAEEGQRDGGEGRPPSPIPRPRAVGPPSFLELSR